MHFTLHLLYRLHLHLCLRRRLHPSSTFHFHLYLRI